MSAAKGPSLSTLLMAFGFPLFVLVAVVAGFLIAAQGGPGALSPPGGDSSSVATDDETLARGEYLARIGDCVACHTARGGEPLAGGRAFATPWGTLYSSNLTADADGAAVRYRIVTRCGYVLTLQHRFVDGSRVYRILSFQERDNGRFIEIEAELRLE